MVAVIRSNLYTSLGALTLGGLTSTALSGVVGMQVILYFRLYENDAPILKAVVQSELHRNLLLNDCSFLDILHTCFVWAADWMYLVSSFGDMNITDHVFWCVSLLSHINRGGASYVWEVLKERRLIALRIQLTIALTAITTFVVHLVSKGNYFVTAPIVIMATTRVAADFCSSFGDWIRLGSYFEFYTHYRWLFTLGLVLSTVVDIIITSSLCLYLRKSRHGGTGRLDHILNSVTLYTIENGMMTCIGTVLSLVFWIVKPHALIYLALHFAIGKLYANSFLASMNARKLLRVQNASSSGSGHRLPVIFTHGLSARDRRSSPDEVDLTGTKVRALAATPGSSATDDELLGGMQLQITVDKTVDYTADDAIPASPSRLPPHDAKGH
ncbi:hypothetical protein IEO21_06052 [Rhodonia placenta]|uniref:DUF6534 domain-containing protein n=1 Tax=Rhodonia placenta TaxID=104341 RepID=A0A8H7P0R3_9APHY|nr:hypothetical protein IEO21_06052 [Postia placenta]